jgi:hypothetical protein
MQKYILTKVHQSLRCYMLSSQYNYHDLGRAKIRGTYMSIKELQNILTGNLRQNSRYKLKQQTSTTET